MTRAIQLALAARAIWKERDIRPKERMSRSFQIARAASANWIALVITFVVAFFLTPFVIHRLGQLSYGIWTLVVSMVSYFGLFDLGLRSAVTRFVAGDSAR